MPKKVLRSLIYETFPYEMRVEIDLLSRRRDLVNEEKQAKLFEIIRKYDIKNVTKLGQGTNRYAFKVNGYVVKVAMDRDGKIDNMKEFKMASLYPDVTKIYEISKNSTLLVAEYIQPFSSFSEMKFYADKIRDKLSKLSSVYLIGDAGIDAKNYVNWGLRPGSDDPVCLDFAYIYDVSSEFFICSKCQTNSMLMPNKDFTKLYCPNTACGAIYLFEDIRRRIGNDIHRLEIGNLEDEGYAITDTNIEMELDPSRSTYLQKKQPKKLKVEEKVEQVPVELDNFILTENGGKIMSLRDQVVQGMAHIKVSKPVEQDVAFEAEIKPTVVTGVAKLAEEKKVDDIIIGTAVLKTEDKPVDDNLEIDDDTEEDPVDQIPFDPDHVDGYQTEPEDEQAEEFTSDDELAAAAEAAVDETSNITDETANEESSDNTVDESSITDILDKEPEFDRPFLEKISERLSTVSNYMGRQVEGTGLFERLSGKVTFNERDFYKFVQNTIFRSLCTFMALIETEVPNEGKPGTHKIWQAPESLGGIDTSAYKFVDEYYKAINYGKFDNLTAKISRGWIQSLTDRIKLKISEDQDVIDGIVETLETYMEPLTPNVSVEIKDTTSYEEAVPIEAATVNTNASVSNEESSESVAFESDMEETKSSDEDEYEGYEEYDDVDGLRVALTEDELGTILHIAGTNDVTPFDYALYFRAKDIPEDKTTECFVNDMNGNFDWLSCFQPDLIFKTKDPYKWINSIEKDNDTQFRCIKLLEEGEFSIMGLYQIDSIIDENNEAINEYDDKMELINYCIMNTLGGTMASHYFRTKYSITKDPSLVLTEEEIEANVTVVDSGEDSGDDYYYDESESEGDNASPDLTDVAAAALEEEDENVTYQPIRRKK